MLRYWGLLMIAYAVANGSRQARDALMDTQIRENVYAIYSAMMTNPKTSHGTDNEEIYLIAEVTEPAFPRRPCVSVPPEYQASLDEILVEYDLRKDKPATLEPAFTIPKPYQFLNKGEVKEFVEMHSLRRTPYPNPKPLFQKATDLFHLGDVYFNRNRTLALTSISTYCGSTCGSSDWKIFEKSNAGQWEQRPWVFCTTIAHADTLEKFYTGLQPAGGESDEF